VAGLVDICLDLPVGLYVVTRLLQRFV